MEYEVVDMEDGTQLLQRSDGVSINPAVVDLVLELHRQNPKFLEHWLKLGEEYAFFGSDVTEA